MSTKDKAITTTTIDDMDKSMVRLSVYHAGHIDEYRVDINSVSAQLNVFCTVKKTVLTVEKGVIIAEATTEEIRTRNRL